MISKRGIIIVVAILILFISMYIYSDQSLSSLLEPLKVQKSPDELTLQIPTKPTKKMCSDLDGNDILVRDSCKVGITTKTDYCSDSNTIAEYTCKNNKCIPIYYDCVDSGYLGGCQNGKCIPGAEPVLDENFEGDTSNWYETAPENSMSQSDSFEIYNDAGNNVLKSKVTSPMWDIHDHYINFQSPTWTNYEVTGKIKKGTNGRAGITFFSQYPSSNNYYRIKSDNNGQFFVSPHVSPPELIRTCSGDINSDVVPATNVWYRYRIQIQDTGSVTNIKAKFWQEGSSEPGTWQIDCSDSGGDRLTYGTVGFWSADSDQNMWDDIQVTPLSIQTSCTNIDNDGYDACDLNGDPVPGCSDPCDCNDIDANINPSADEICWNGVDENCNKNLDETCENDPPQASLNSPSNGALNVLTSPTLSVTVTDADSPPQILSATFYGRDTTSSGDTFSIIVLPDTQKYVDSLDSNNWLPYLESQAQWIVDNKDSLNIKMVLHEGDLVQNADQDVEWQRIDSSLTQILNANIPIGFAPGDHDHYPEGSNGVTTKYQEYLPASRFTSYNWWGGNTNDNTNNYQLLTIGNDNYIFINLDVCPNSNEIQWANDVLNIYSDRKAILTTHALIDTNGNYEGTSDCDSDMAPSGDTSYIWDSLIKLHGNLQLVLCGHMHTPNSEGESHITEINNAGKRVDIFLANYQDSNSWPNGGDGLLRILTFDPTNDVFDVETYSAHGDYYETDANSKYDNIPYGMTGGAPTNFNSLTTITGLQNNDIANFDWNGLNYNTGYEWYVDVSDSVAPPTTSPTWSFTTEENSVPTCTALGGICCDLATETCNNPITGTCNSGTCCSSCSPIQQGSCNPQNSGVILNEDFTNCQIFPTDNWWNLDITNAPVDSNSQSLKDWIGSSTTLHLDAGTTNNDYGIPYVGVSGSTPLTPGCYDGGNPPHPWVPPCSQLSGQKLIFVSYPADSDYGYPWDTAIGYPIPEEAKTNKDLIEGSTPGGTHSEDSHMLIIDRDNMILYETFGAYWNPSTNRWEPKSGATFNLKTNDRRPEGWTSVDAAGLEVFPGLVKPAEINSQNPINHAFRFTIRASNGYVWPAIHAAGTTSGALPMGARLRLHNDVNIPGISSEGQKVLDALKTYGLILADNGQDMYIQGTSGQDSGLYDKIEYVMDRLTVSDFDVIELGWDPTGQSLASASSAQTTESKELTQSNPIQIFIDFIKSLFQ